MTREIMQTARRHLAVDGAAGLSLRAVARDMGMVSSAVYRYVPSRDELLTRLIIEAYDSLGEAVEQAERKVPRDALGDRFRAVAGGVRHWAIAHEHEYALIYGSPVPGYRAPQDTVGPATRVPGVLIAIISDALAAGVAPSDLHTIPGDVAASIEPVRASFAAGGQHIPEDLVVRGLMAWTYLFGAVSFDLFGHRHNVVLDERDPNNPFVRYETEKIITLIGLPERIIRTDR
jgi:AcrR family transcriptional regulator